MTVRSRGAKRAFDVVASAAGLVVLAPLFAVIAAGIAIDSGRPVFFRHARVGRGGRPFRMWKFRTMKQGSERFDQITASGDARITPFGRVLKNLKLDELPQLINVLLGEMSLVGPRPEVSAYVERYTPAQRRVLDLTPGITDPASIAYADEATMLAGFDNPALAYVARVMPDKIRISLEYAERATWWSDLGVILQTLGVIGHAPQRPPAPGSTSSRGAALLVGHRTTARVAGVSLAFEMLIAGFDERHLSYVVVDLARAGPTDRPGALRIGRVVRSLAILVRYTASLPTTRRVYLTISSSRLGFFRDAYIILAARLLRRRVVLHLNGGGYGRFYLASSTPMRALIRCTLGVANAIVVPGELLRGQFRFVRGARTRVVVIRNGLPEADPRLLCEQKHLAPTERVHLLYLSNMIPTKGYMHLLRACRLLLDRGRDFDCSFCGEFVDIASSAEPGSSAEPRSAEDARAAFLQAVTDWGLADRVRYLGVVRGDRKLEQLRRAHVFVLPTTYPWEGQPVSIIEALACGTPVVATAYRGTPEQVITGYDGELIPTPDAVQIADAVERVVADPQVYARLSRNAFAQYREWFSREAYQSGLIAQILGETPQAR